MRTRTFAAGTGNWKKFTSIVLSSEPGARWEEVEGTTIVHTPLDLVLALEADATISEVILAGAYADNRSVLAFLRDAHPEVPVTFEASPRSRRSAVETEGDPRWASAIGYDRRE